MLLNSVSRALIKYQDSIELKQAGSASSGMNYLPLCYPSAMTCHSLNAV